MLTDYPTEVNLCATLVGPPVKISDCENLHLSRNKWFCFKPVD